MGEAFSRMSISLPADLKAQMEAVTEQVNWSALAAKAFRDKLAKINSRKRGATEMDDINRVLATEEEGEMEEYQAGFAAGQTWARKDATFKELQRLSRLEDDLKDSDQLANAVWPEEIKRGRAKPTEFWIKTLGEDDVDRAEDPDFLRGFLAGALDFWRQVEQERASRKPRQRPV